MLERSSVWTAGFAKLAIGSKTNSCCFGGGLSWCLRRLGSLFILLSWLALKRSLVECGTIVLVLCFLMHQNSWLTSLRFPQKLKNLEKFKFEIHGVLPDVCIIDTCFETNEQKKVTCFVMNADNLTMLCRESDVDANDNLQRQFGPSCKISNVSFEI